MNPQTRRSAFVFVGLLGFVTASWLIFRGYLTSDMLVYFLTFQWCL
jgi:hypothetical protein